METFVNTAEGGGVNGVRFKAQTMHAIGWVLRHTYPFMVLDRSDANNEVWSSWKARSTSAVIGTWIISTPSPAAHRKCT